MSVETAALVLVSAVVGYLFLGIVFAVPFLLRGVERVDPAARGAGVGFRLVVLPGVVALWPLLLRRWRRSADGPPVESNLHRRAARKGSNR